MLNAKTLKHIQRIGVETDHLAAFGGKSKGNKHLSRVVKIAKFMAMKTGADLKVTEAGAWLHDTALPTGNDYDPATNKRVVKKMLKDVDLTAAEIELISECVASHEGTKRPSLLEAQIVHDADVIEKTGILGIIRHTWKLTNSGKIDHANVKDADARTVLLHITWRRAQLRLPLSRKFARTLSVPMSTKQAREIVAITAPLAHRGVITEKIAKVLEKKLSKKQVTALKSQLAVAYLK